MERYNDLNTVKIAVIGFLAALITLRDHSRAAGAVLLGAKTSSWNGK